MPKELAQEIVNFLQKKPYEEVVLLINKIVDCYAVIPTPPEKVEPVPPTTETVKDEKPK